MALSEHLEKLRHFHRVAGFKSMREGALKMGISQAGLSKSIASLEDVLDTKLFIRSNDGLILTKEGAEVLKTSELILAEAADLELKLRSLKASSTPKTLRIGMYDSIAVYFFSDLSAYMTTLYPSVRMELTVETSANLAEKMLAGKVDLAIGVNLEPKKKAKIEFFKLFDDHYSFYISAGFQGDKGKSPLLIHPYADDAAGSRIENLLAASIKTRGAHRVLNFETLKTLTLQNMGIGVMPTQVAKPLLKKDLLVPLAIAKERQLFGLHNIGFLAADSLIKTHRDFVEDIYRLGQRWSKS